MNDTLSFAGFSTTPLELISFALAVAMVLMNIRQNHWGWLLGIVSSATYGIVFFNARLYGDASLQLVFIASGIWGWYQWLRGAGESKLAVTRLNNAGWLWSGAGWGIGFVLLALFLRAYTNTDVPNADGFLTAGSLLGTVLLARKKVENWHVWIAVDVLYVGLYVYKGLMLTAILYAIFVALAIGGLRAWSNVAAVGAR
ncbi:nicotinamide riboside transporter PnuC [Massilia terrae]|uniref:Nicotinamide riboside transporter PnuC n=1 Tax=Massilia terrae TaxID=1811224 RepID=A0ABT2CS25_9BURK|nr:nicotinamide riboside transporter PnuC [Massilia terrae]MCS0656629.1 nicotinamide riboside transporter PnuC [Massilia terrae]